MRHALLLSAALLAGCGIVPTTRIDTARIVPGQFGTGTIDPDTSAVYLAQWAFADPARTAGRPVEGARAVAAMDYIAGELNTSPRWANIPAVTQLQLLAARTEVRRTLGIRPDAPSQAVVDRLSMTADALAHDDRSAALAQLATPAFTLPPERTLYALAYLPRLPEANVATMHAAYSLYDPDSGGHWR